ncbi:MAG: DUF3943 domain-containing protein [Treponema sp.]|nr:DUF3943 domain-containing protein [Treponema sp.]
MGITVPVFSQSETGSWKINPAADIFYTLFDINASNLFLNYTARLVDASFAGVTFETIGQNIYPATWFWEDGDRFTVNQFGHPYQGSTYFASARINGFSFYTSIPFVLIGSLQWEMLYEPESGINDVISTFIGGISLGEMLHRLFLEVDASPSIKAKIGGFFVSPIESFNAVFNRPKREEGRGNMYSLSVRAGAEKSFTYFTGHQSEAASWRYPGAYIGVNVIYGNPFVQESRTPYDHFELHTELTTNIAFYQIQILSDGYIFSFAPSHSQKIFTSTGLTMHYDFFNATNDIIDNTGYGNIPFSSNAVDWTVKHAVILSEQAYISVKAHAGLILWGTSMYNSSVFSDTYLGDTHSAYGMGENLKLFFTVSHKKAGTLELTATGYHIFNIPVTDGHSTGNVFFINGSITYDIPLSKRIGIGAVLRYWNLFGLYDAAENVYRRLVSAGLYTSIRF